MIIKTIQEDIFKSNAKHIAFAINTEGYNDSGFAGQISSLYWNELENCGQHEIGTVLSKTIKDKTFHALVCHSLKEGWGENQAKIIQKCFDKISANKEPIATIAIGTGLIGMLSGANFKQIVYGMHTSRQKIILHTGYTTDTIMNWYNEEKERQDLIREKNLAIELFRKGFI